MVVQHLVAWVDITYSLLYGWRAYCSAACRMFVGLSAVLRGQHWRPVRVVAITTPAWSRQLAAQQSCKLTAWQRFVSVID